MYAITYCITLYFAYQRILFSLISGGHHDINQKFANAFRFLRHRGVSNNNMMSIIILYLLLCFVFIDVGLSDEVR